MPALRTTPHRKWPQLQGLNPTDYQRERAKILRAENIARGLTFKGTPRVQRRKWPAGTTKAQMNIVYERERRRRLDAQGLTSRGTPRKNARYPELAKLDQRTRVNTRSRIWERRRRQQESRAAVAALLIGAPLAAKLRRAA